MAAGSKRLIGVAFVAILVVCSSRPATPQQRTTSAARIVSLVPALTAFVAAHERLRGADAPRWRELTAVHERAGLFGVLEWLGLPASRQTVTVLQNVLDPDLPHRLLEPLRSVLWEPETVLVLQRTRGLTDRQLARFCHPLAA